MALWEPAGREHNKGNSAELFGWAHSESGVAGKNCGTVCRFSAVVLSAYTIAYLIIGMDGLSVEVHLCRFFVITHRRVII